MTENISQADFYQWPVTKELLATLKLAGIDARFVGGAVRDALLGRLVNDVDLASTTPPEEAMHALRHLGLKVLPTGIEHGTITIVLSGKPFELTTLRRDVECDGRHAVVAYTDSWHEDAKRRDFTINALYADSDGIVHDYVNGISDLKAKKLAFIGQADARIKEDALRILRLFRFQAQLNFSVDASLYEVCKKHVKLLNKVSIERISHECLKLLTASAPDQAWQAMFDYGIAGKIFDKQLSNRLDALVSAERKLATGNLTPVGRLALLAWMAGSRDAEDVQEMLKLSNAQTRLIARVLACTPHMKSDMSINEQRKWHYLLGSEIYRLCIAAAAAEQLAQHMERSQEHFARMISDSKQWMPPTFPIGGEDLKAKGFTQGEKMGEALRKLEQLWIDSGFELSKEDLLRKAS